MLLLQRMTLFSKTVFNSEALTAPSPFPWCWPVSPVQGFRLSQSVLRGGTRCQPLYGETGLLRLRTPAEGSSQN